MIDFSVELITKGEKSLIQSLDSISKQSYDSLEIVCANSSTDQKTEKILDDYSARYLIAGPVKHLRGRELAHSISKGKYSLIMDSTRLLKQDALEVLKTYIEQYDMVAIKEGSLGSGFWVEQARVYRNFTERNSTSKFISEKIPSYILPRLFRSDILSEVFLSLRKKIPSKLFDSIGYGEHHIIFEEAMSFTSSLYYYKESALLEHYEDLSLSSIYRKYKSYGKDQKTLEDLPCYNASHLLAHSRKINMSQLLCNLICSPLISARTISFLLGRFL